MSVRINLGTKVLDYNSGLKTENIPLECFKYNILISGQDQTERSALLSHILNQIYERVTNIGVLLIKLNSDENTNLYHLDRVYEYGDPNLEIPYFFGNALSAVHREHFERCINAVFGFHFEMSIVIGCLLLHYKIGKVKPVHLRAKVIEMGEKKIKVSCELYSGKNLCVTGGIIAIRIG